MKVSLTLPIGQHYYQTGIERVKKEKEKSEETKSFLFPQNFLGRDLISFTSRSFSETLDENYFKLKEGYQPDKFQKQAGYHLNGDKNVLVVAPTGTGKTAIAHYAISKNLDEGKKTFYTTPLKALSNQKFREFKEVYGEENVGIMTGDRRENPDAPILIMTTEVFRNMALSEYFEYNQDIMKNLGTVIFDEFHYLGDEDRGPVWEEAIMFTPKNVQTLALSATVGNGVQLQNWINTLNQKGTELVHVPSENRHVPLEFHEFETDDLKTEKKRATLKHNNHNVAQNDNEKPTVFDFRAITSRLAAQKQLPAIYFVFSKKFSSEIVEFLGKKGQDLTTDDEKKEIKEILERYKTEKYLGNNLNEQALLKGYAVHNAGIMPDQKELIEELFQKKLVKVVVATETLAAGINMPAKTVVISSYQKPSNQSKVPQQKGKNRERESKVRSLTANEFHQMAGRAGRRGIDEIGHVYVIPKSMKSSAAFDRLIKSQPEAIDSKLNPDYAFLASFYSYVGSTNALKDALSKSFYAFKSGDETKTKQLIYTALDKTKVMEQRGFLNKENNEYSLTPMGELLTTMKGYAQLPLVEAIYKRYFDGFTPEALASVIASIANPAETLETNDNNSKGINNKVSIKALYEDMRRTLAEKLPYVDKQLADFKDMNEVISYLNTIEMPSESISELGAKRRLYMQKVDRMEKLQDKYASWSVQSIAKDLAKGESVSLTAMEACQKKVEEYKKKYSYTTLESRLAKLTKKLEDLDMPSKSGRERKMYKAEANDLQYEIDLIKSIMVLDEKLPDAINSAYKFLKEENYNSLLANAEKYDKQYNLASNLQVLKVAARGCASVEKYMQTHNLDAEDTSNGFMISDGMKQLIQNTIQIDTCKRANNVHEEPDIYGQEALNLIYNWAQLNKINSDSRANWEQLIMNSKLQEKGMDEGKIFRTIVQTIDLLNQVAEIAANGEKLAQNDTDKSYYRDLRNNAVQAVKLLKKDPVIFD